MIRHHRLLELYLAEALGMPWDRVHEEAEVLEHAISPELSELIAEKLGNPTHDPHGDPIPTADGEIDEAPSRPLAEREPGDRGTFVRVSDADPEMLRYLSERGIAPGDEFEVVEKEPFDGPISVRFGERVHVLGGALTRAMSTEGGGPVTRPPRRGRGTRLDGHPAVIPPSPLEERPRARPAAHTLALLGPAFVAAVAYVDPGNFATNIAGGAKYGYLLLWVILAANLMAMLIQYLSAKVGIATGRNLPELCREHFPRPVSVGLWVQAELIAMATDLAEFVGAAIALNLLFGVPLFAAGPDHRGRRLRDPRPPAARLPALRDRDRRAARRDPARLPLRDAARRRRPGRDRRRLRAGLQGTESVLLATGILGATVMPHVIYLHSALTQDRVRAARRRRAAALLRFERLDVGSPWASPAS